MLAFATSNKFKSNTKRNWKEIWNYAEEKVGSQEEKET